jgi:hypothetical protein
MAAKGSVSLTTGRRAIRCLLAQMYAATLGRAELHRLIERQSPRRRTWRPAGLHRRLTGSPLGGCLHDELRHAIGSTSCSSLKNYEQHRLAARRGYCAPTAAPRKAAWDARLWAGSLIATQEDYRRYPQIACPVRESGPTSGDGNSFRPHRLYRRRSELLGVDRLGSVTFSVTKRRKFTCAGCSTVRLATRALLDSRQVTAVESLARWRPEMQRRASTRVRARLVFGRAGERKTRAPAEVGAARGDRQFARIPPLPPTKNIHPLRRDTRRTGSRRARSTPVRLSPGRCNRGGQQREQTIQAGISHPTACANVSGARSAGMASGGLFPLGPAVRLTERVARRPENSAGGSNYVYRPSFTSTRRTSSRNGWKRSTHSVRSSRSGRMPLHQAWSGRTQKCAKGGSHWPSTCSGRRGKIWTRSATAVWRARRLVAVAGR